MDNFYTGLALMAWLWAQKIQACGTLKSKRRGIPTLETVTKASPRDTYDWTCLQNHPMHAVVGFWKDNKLVRFITTIHGHERAEHTRMQK